MDQLAGARMLVVALDPELGQGILEGQLAQHARGVRVEDPGANASVGEVVRKQVRFREV
jgi:hypothetical protein